MALQNLLRVVGHMKAPADMTAGEINKALDKLDKARHALTNAMIAVGRGYEKYNETLEMAARMKSLKTQLLSTIVVIYRDDNLQLWGIPYDMRPGQSPRDLQRAAQNYVPPRPGHYGSPRPTATASWLWLGSPGWWGSLSKEDQSAIKGFLAKLHVPGNPGEWDRVKDALR